MLTAYMMSATKTNWDININYPNTLFLCTGVSISIAYNSPILYKSNESITLEITK